MKLIELSDLFEVKYGNSLELNRLKESPDGINFVSRTAQNNGVTARVIKLDSLEPFPAGTITVSLGGSVLESFMQSEVFYTGYHIYCLTPKSDLSDDEKLYYCACIFANRYRYNYGRQANRTLKKLLIPDPSEIPRWIYNRRVDNFDDASKPYMEIQTQALETALWKNFKLFDLFELKKGKRLTKANMTKGETPFIGSIDNNNGCREYIGQDPNHSENTISVNYNGSVAEAFYQPNPFWASDDVNVLYPKFEMNQFSALFIASIIKLEKYRFNYGRKWHLIRMKEAIIKLPSEDGKTPDYDYMEMYIKTLKYSKLI